MKSNLRSTPPPTGHTSLEITILLFLLCAPLGTISFAQGDRVDSVNQSWFWLKEITPDVWRIDDHGGGNMYLVLGKDKALLIDAGNGVADLAACVKSITSLPLVVVNTHGHPDHCGSDFEFSEVYAQPADFDMIKSFCNETFHKDRVDRARKQSPGLEHLLTKDIQDFKPPALLPVRGGFVFELGGRTLEVVETPGHTKGSICLLDRANKLLFTGDDNNTLVWLFLKDCLPLESYLQTLEDLRRRSDQFDTLLPGHGDPLDKGFIDEQIVCAKNILSGDCKGEPYKTFVDNARVCNYKRARIAFNPDNLRARNK